MIGAKNKALDMLNKGKNKPAPSTDLINKPIIGKSEPSSIDVEKIFISPNRRAVNEDKVGKLIESIREIGLMNPITLAKDNRLIAGAHRLQAYKIMGLKEIPFTYLDKDDNLHVELAEIDENLIRSDLHFLELGEVLQRRKDIYEELYPETKHNAKFKGNQYSEDRSEEPGSVEQKIGLEELGSVEQKIRSEEPDSFEQKTFSEDTAAKTGYTARKINQDIQIARDLTDEAKEAVIKYDAKKKEALSVSRLKPEEQNQIAKRVSNGEDLSDVVKEIENKKVADAEREEETALVSGVEMRLSGLLPELEELIKKIKQVHNVVSVSAPYKNKGENKIYRIYIKIAASQESPSKVLT